MKGDSNKTRDLYKRIELTLRAHGPRLSAVRRGTPSEYSFWMKEVEDFARNGRTEALNSFYGHTVFREKPTEQQANKPIQKLDHAGQEPTMNARASILLLTIAILFLFGNSACLRAFQTHREHLTEQEVELVKEAQILDKRIDVFIKAADRRIQVITGIETTTPKQLKKDAELWGPLPTGTRPELIGDIARIFDEAITNIDDVSARDEKNPLVAVALRNLAAAATRIVGQLKPFEEQAKGDPENSSFD